jgi:hypothetical protein
VQLLYYKGAGGDDGDQDEFECVDQDGDGDECGHDYGGIKGRWDGRGGIDLFT